MNKKYKLPKYIVIMPDHDIINFVDLQDEEGALQGSKAVLKYLIKEINKYVDARFKDLYRKRSGADRKGKPRIIWVKMIERPTAHTSIAQRIRQSYNECLDDLLLAEGHTYMLELNLLNEERYFDKAGKLLGMGRVQLWKEIDQHLKDFDRKKVNLLPGLLQKETPSKPQQQQQQQQLRTPTRQQQRPRKLDRYHVDNRQWSNPQYKAPTPNAAPGSGYYDRRPYHPAGDYNYDFDSPCGQY